MNNNKNNVLLQTARACVSSVDSDRFALARIMFDTGSQRSYVTSSLRRRLNLPTLRKDKIVIQTFGNKYSKARDVDIVQLKVKGKSKGSVVFVEAICVPDICSPLKNQNIDLAVQRYEHLENLELADCSEGSDNLNVDVLIGLDFYFSFVTGVVKKGREGPVAIESTLGWIISGVYNCLNGHNKDTAVLVNTTHALRINCFEEDSLTNVLNRFWNVDSLGVDNEVEVVIKFEQELTFNGEHYVVKLPIKPHHEFLPDNYNISSNRLISLMSKLVKKTLLCAEYDKVIKNYIAEGIVETVDSPGEPGSVHYLPHRAVVREDKETTKVRIVFDASAKLRNEPSLNDCLYSGPCLLPAIYDILLRFRLGKIGLVSDIQQAFLNIEVAEEHRDLLRFLWFKNIDSDDPKIVVLRFARVVFGLTSSPFLLNGTIASHLSKIVNKNIDVELLEKVLRDLYVDDSTTSLNEVSEGMEFYLKSKRYLSEGGFNLRKWATNDKELREFIDSKENIESSDMNDLTYVENELGVSENFRKVLGINWDVDKDVLVFELIEIANNGLSLGYTKRNILRISASFFDPLGLICPIVLQAKLLFKELCELKVDWDEVVKSEISEKWNRFLNDLKNCGYIYTNRFVLSCVREKIVSIELHGFCDSSSVAYAAVVYVKVVTSIGVSVNLLSAKSKVAPLKNITIPRLELLSCLLLSRLLVSIKNAVEVEIKIDRCVNWSDSEIALFWIKGRRKEWKPWVENRVNKIRDRVSVDSWRHVSGEVNPADLATREGLIRDIMTERWWKGPEFIMSDESGWPTQKIFNGFQSKLVLEEAKKSSLCDEELLIINETVKGTTANLAAIELKMNIQVVINMEKFNSFKKLCRVTAFVFRFVNNLKKSISNKKEQLITDEEITIKELDSVERIWLEHAQFELINNSKYDQIRKSLKLYKDENSLLRSKTRLSEASELAKDVKFPVVLPSEGHITKIIILDAHEDVLHTKVESTLNRVRNRFWIIRGRQTVQKVIKRCVLCKWFQGKTLKPRPIAALPSWRVCSEYPFENTGLDYAGPLLVLDIYSENNSKMHKCYILLFTCATTRCIHLELTPDMSTPTLILALRRFLARKGYPEKFISDNFKTFKSVILKKFLRNNHIDWEFILERSPWWGGFYERLVKVVKDALRKVIKNARLNYDELTTVLIEIESMINSRPLTYLSEENIEAITPFHLLHGRNIAVGGHSLLKQDSTWNLTNRVKYIRMIIEQFWKRFYNEYTVALRERMMYDKTKRNEEKLSIGDVVIIREDRITPRSKWKHGRVDELLTGRDGVVRGAILTTNTNGKNIKLSRPLQRLIPLEVSNERTGDKTELIHVNEHETRPKRAAALTGELIRRTVHMK